MDKENNYYLFDAGKHRVLAFDSDWDFKFAIDRESLPNDIKREEGPREKAINISDICTDEAGKIYLVDSMGSNVLVFNDKGEYLRSIGQPGAAFNTLSLPSGVAVDGQGRVLVIDATGHGMLGYDQKGKLLFALGGLGKSEGRFYFPKNVATDRNGRIYVVEPFLGRVQVLNVETS
jgi:DNA-binding beta-propeller fold protein YncE